MLSVLFPSVLLASAVVAFSSHNSIARAVHHHTRDHFRSFHGPDISTTHGPTEYAPTWAGSVLDLDNGGTFSSITGTFIVPEVRGPNGAVSSAWVGIDGHNECAQGLLQTGVDFNVVDDQVQYDVWYEWYPEMPDGFNTTIDISQGDTIKVTIKAYSPTSGFAMVENLTKNQTGSKNLTSSYELCQESAEWIMEDYEGDSAPLAYFTPLTFTNAEAKSGNKTYTPFGSTIVDIEQNGQVLTSVTTGNSTVTIRRLEI